MQIRGPGQGRVRASAPQSRAVGVPVSACADDPRAVVYVQRGHYPSGHSRCFRLVQTGVPGRRVERVIKVEDPSVHVRENR